MARGGSTTPGTRASCVSLLMTLYGGRDILASAGVEVDEQDEFKDGTGRGAIFVSSGMVTALLRDAWMLNLHELIGNGATKTAETAQEKREMSKESKEKEAAVTIRHHALDAVGTGIRADDRELDPEDQHSQRKLLRPTPI